MIYSSITTATQPSIYSLLHATCLLQPNLCYLEGQWTNVDGDTIDEPFHSERHHLDADSFFDLQV